MEISATKNARRESLANVERVSNAARRVVEIFENTPKTIHYGFPPEMRQAIRRLKNLLDDSRLQRPRSKRKVKG